MGDAQTYSEKCLDLIRQSEGCRLKAYYDVSGYTIGWGHHDSSVSGSTVWSQSQADDQLLQDTETACKNVLHAVKVPLAQGQLDALTDFVYNLGIGSLQESTLLKLLNLGEYNRIPNEFGKWIYSDGKINQALVVRRQKEVELWNGG